MRVFNQIFVLVASLLFGDAIVHGQITHDPSGHWEGTITTPMGEIRIEIDLARGPEGGWRGTVGAPDQKERGFPLTTLTVDGASVSFSVRGGQGGTFRGTLGADGGSMSGTVSAPEGTAPFALQRTGEAVILAPPKSAKIGKELEGTWNGTLEVKGGLRVILRMANNADGTSSGLLVSVDEGNLEIPVAIVQDGPKLQLTSPMIPSTYAATLNAAGTELTGTFTTSQGLALPLTLKRQ